MQEQSTSGDPGFDPGQFTVYNYLFKSKLCNLSLIGGLGRDWLPAKTYCQVILRSDMMLQRNIDFKGAFKF